MFLSKNSEQNKYTYENQEYHMRLCVVYCMYMPIVRFIRSSNENKQFPSTALAVAQIILN